MITQPEITSGRLRLTPRSAAVQIQADAEGEHCYRARFDGPEPAIREDGNTIIVEYPRFARKLPWRRGVVELRLDPAVAW